MNQKQRQTILIVDDTQMNRSILADILEDKYDIIEAEDGLEAVAILQKQWSSISMLLLDLYMPKMNGYEVLEVMNNNRWIETIPVIIISSENKLERIHQAYDLGVTDFLSRPFDDKIVRRRVFNTMLLYAKQKDLETLATEQIYEKEQRSSLMVDILSHIVEFRNGESGLHVLNVRTVTELLLNALTRKTDRYQLSQADISLISTASALHDIGKIAIDDKILNKPGRLTEEEFAIMKTHSSVGAQMLEQLPIHQGEPLIKVAYDICRWHHERYDGRGYPDGLTGDDIPISAQVVAMADVYDALTSKRVYKPPFPPQKAIEMILRGECGTFNPLLLDCLQENALNIAKALQASGEVQTKEKSLQNIVREMSQHYELNASNRTLQLLEHERMKYSFFAAMSQEIQFEYTLSPDMLSLNSWGAERLGMDEIIMDPLHNKKVRGHLGEEEWEKLTQLIHAAGPESPISKYECKLFFGGELRWYRITCQSIWSNEDEREYMGVIGKAVDIHSSRTDRENLERMASYDMLTDLLNAASAKKQIEERLRSGSDSQFAMAIFDLDHFKSANDTYGHIFGNRVLAHVAERLRSSVRGGDIAARIGGDEFLIFLEYTHDLEPIIQRIFSSLSGEDYRGFPISASMGVARAEAVGCEYGALFQAADQALYAVKQGGRGHYRFYDSSMASLAVPEREQIVSDNEIVMEEGE